MRFPLNSNFILEKESEHCEQVLHVLAHMMETPSKSHLDDVFVLATHVHRLNLFLPFMLTLNRKYESSQERVLVDKEYSPVSQSTMTFRFWNSRMYLLPPFVTSAFPKGGPGLMSYCGKYDQELSAQPPKPNSSFGSRRENIARKLGCIMTKISNIKEAEVIYVNKSISYFSFSILTFHVRKTEV